jgi:pseudaminic acid synthase
MLTEFDFSHRSYGELFPPYVIAELSANHNQSLELALKLVEAAASSGANAIKLQTYTPDSLTLNSRKKDFYLPSVGSPWAGKRLWELYDQAYTPWEWHEEIFARARELGMGTISTAFDKESVDFLLGLKVDALKIASFELINIPLIRKSAETGLPLLISTGMGSLSEIQEAVETVRNVGKSSLVLLKCTSAYPSQPKDANLRAISDLRSRFGVAVGLSDHTMSISVASAATALGACVIEKHLTLSRELGGPDSGFSLEPVEFKEMVSAVQSIHETLGETKYGIQQSEIASAWERPSIWVTKDIAAGELFTQHNLRVVRPSGGMHPRELTKVLGKQASCKIEAESPLQLMHVKN